MSNLVLWILKFVIDHLRLDVKVCHQPIETGLSGQQDFKVCDWSLRLVSGGQLQTLKSTRPSWTFETSAITIQCNVLKYKRGKAIGLVTVCIQTCSVRYNDYRRITRAPWYPYNMCIDSCSKNET